MKGNALNRPGLRMANLSLAAILSAAAIAQYAGSTPPPAPLKAGFNAISQADARKHLGYLAGPECEGRGTGQPGFQKAAEYMAARFKEFGLKPVGDNGTYFQNVPFVRTRISPGVSNISVDGGPKFERIRFIGVSSVADVSGPVAFVRGTGTDPTLEDVSVLDGKIVIVSAPQTARALRRQFLGTKVVAILNVTAKAPSVGEWSARPASGGRQGGGPQGGAGTAPGVVRGEIGLEDAKALAKAVGVWDGMVYLDGGSKDSASIESSTKTATITAKIDIEQIGVPNVIALLEGSDPALKAEVVGIGAHLDHLGKSGGRIFWGADDDGSGSTALLLVAKALSQTAQKPKRSILFMAFCGEEMGLIGSRYQANNPTVPLDKMICELQMDMVGRDSEGVQNGDRNRVDILAENHDTMRLVGSQRISMDLHKLVLDMNRHVNFKFKFDSEDVYTRSDHYSFAAKGVPIAFLFDGFHPDYHQPTDTPDKINYEKIANAAKLFYLTAWNAANRDSAFPRNAAGSGGG